MARSSHLDADTLQKPGRFLSTNQAKHVIALDHVAFLRWFTRFAECNLIPFDLLDRLSEVSLDTARIDAIVNHHLVAELEISLEVTPDYERNNIVSPGCYPASAR